MQMTNNSIKSGPGVTELSNMYAKQATEKSIVEIDIEYSKNKIEYI